MTDDTEFFSPATSIEIAEAIASLTQAYAIVNEVVGDERTDRVKDSIIAALEALILPQVRTFG